jgi:hypothetical protein
MEKEDDDDVIICETQVEVYEISDSEDENGNKKPKKFKTENVSILVPDVIQPSISSATSREQETLSVTSKIKEAFGGGKMSADPTSWLDLKAILEAGQEQSEDFGMVRSIVIETGVMKLLFDSLELYSREVPKGAGEVVQETVLGIPRGAQENHLVTLGIPEEPQHNNLVTLETPGEAKQKQVEQDKIVAALFQVLAR